MATWEVAMVTLLGVQGVKMPHENMIYHKPLENLELRQTVLMVGKMAMVGNTMFNYDEPNNTTDPYKAVSLPWAHKEMLLHGAPYAWPSLACKS